MLKTLKNGKLWLVTQPDHAQVAGYFAAHWGNDAFARPGYFASAPDPERLRAETVKAIAQHDNGWWEWEASPQISAEDALPFGLAELLSNQQEGMDRWRLGLRRFDEAPYVNLLISHHAYWLYAARAIEDPDPAFTHPLFWNGSPEKLYPGERSAELDFIAEIEGLQRQWVDALRRDEECASWVEPEHLFPHARLLQLLDGLSLSICSALIAARSGEPRGLGADEFELHDVPRRSWNDRVTIHAKPAGERRIVLDPYPFDRDPLPVNVPARTFDLSADRAARFQTWWHAQPMELIQFRFGSAR